MSLAYDDSAEADLAPVVFLHGLSSARSTWARVVPGLRGRCRVLALDQRGHGDSDHAPGTYELATYGPDTASFCERIVGRPSVLVGHSLGGVIAAFVAQRRPELVRAVFLEDPPLYVGRSASREPGSIAAMFPLLRRVRREMRERGAPLPDYEAMVRRTPSLNRAETTMADVLGDEGALALARAIMNGDPEVFTPAIDGEALAGIDPSVPLKCPARVLRADPALGAAFSGENEAEFLATNPGASVHTMTGASHAIHDEQTSEFVSDLLAFLDGLP